MNEKGEALITKYNGKAATTFPIHLEIFNFFFPFRVFLDALPGVFENPVALSAQVGLSYTEGIMLIFCD